MGTDDGRREVVEQGAEVARIASEQARRQVVEDLGRHRVRRVTGQVVGVPAGLAHPGQARVGLDADVDLLQRAHGARGEVLEGRDEREVLPVDGDGGDLHAITRSSGGDGSVSSSAPVSVTT